ncbi:membrane-associated phospholipid phosphatase [Rhodoferax saidenbachensis]|uniref:Membrane-associated phospholipid phosphatase n=1 Tax=Rhodoferax saidenbachensis TaxID=1484693 RepID=A0ABU1ZPH9_9BURK|nr:membrane-associated phospholipid phosphatase [Rhodoferax saidenbachensis]
MTATRATWQQRLRHLLLNAAVFGLCYTSANLLAQRLDTHRSVAIALDAHLAFVPWMVLPYMLSGVFFIACFWAVDSLDALRVLSQRLLLATVLACLVFVLYPLQFSFARPGVASPLWAPWYATLKVMDRPYNQLPSLHVAYCLIFWFALRPCCAGRSARTALLLTLSMVAIATLFTYQHHVLDVLAGGLLGWACVRVVRPQRQEPWVALYYALGTGVVVVLGMAWWPWWLTAYGAASLLTVARAYAMGDAHFLHKTQGRFAWWVWLLYAPYLLGYRLTWLCVQWRERKRPPFAQMAPGLWVGRRLTNVQTRLLPPGCTVVDLANELSETPALRTERYHPVPLLDLVQPGNADVQRVLALVHDTLQCGHPVYLHCAMGYSRSRRIASAYLAQYPQADALH